jgi:hypothetical protein
MSDGPQGSGALDLRGRSAERAAQAGQGDPLVRGEGTQGIFPVARQGTPRSTRIASPLYQRAFTGSASASRADGCRPTTTLGGAARA